MSEQTTQGRSPVEREPKGRPTVLHRDMPPGEPRSARVSPDPRSPAVTEAIPIDRLALRIIPRAEGRSLPWLGRALRGLVAKQWKEESCTRPRDEHGDLPSYCRGCAEILDCSYGVHFEREPSADTQAWQGQADALRPLVLAPHFPSPSRFRPGSALGVSLTILGEHASRLSRGFVTALATAGDTGGLGPDRVPFDVAVAPDSATRAYLSATALPLSPNGVPVTLPRLRVVLTSPLYLKSLGHIPMRGTVSIPFDQLLRASLRTVSSLFRIERIPLDADFRALKEAAQTVESTRTAFRPFQQSMVSTRQRSRFQKRGVQGFGEYTDVPLSLIPWLFWGGALHTGGLRVAGAGGWRVDLDGT